MLTQYFNQFIKKEELAMFMEGRGQLFDKESVEDMLMGAVMTKWNPIETPPETYELCLFILKGGKSRICCLYEVEDAILWIPYKHKS